MKQWLLGGVLAIVGIAILTAPNVTALNVNNFSIEDYEIKYELSRDSSGHSQLKTIEYITAVFPDFDQNHGLERVIPKTNDGHSTNLRIKSVEMSDGTPWQYSVDMQQDKDILRIGSPSSYVHGEQTYVVTYTQSDVTRYFSDTDTHEFYWDTNGTSWRVPIEKLRVSLAVEENLQNSLTDGIACYAGVDGDSTACELSRAANIFTMSTSNLLPAENVTIAVGFTPETFAEYEPTLLGRLYYIWIAITVIVSIMAIIVTVWLFVRWNAWSNRKKSIGTIVPEYLPPDGVSVTTVAGVLGVYGSVFSAQLLDFAVRHYIKIYENDKQSLFKSVNYTIEVIKDPISLKAEEREILNDIFERQAAVGDRLDLSSLRNNRAVYGGMSDNDTKLSQLMRGTYALRGRNPEQTAWFNKVGTILLIVAAATFNPFMMIAAVCAFVCAQTLWPLTDKGVALHRHVAGMKLYIHVAETERLQILQSPEGATKTGNVDINNPGQLLRLYERMLPYAVLFEEEKEWSKRIGELYDTSQTTPDWYSGSTGLSGATFASSINSFSSSRVYASSHSSSRGGSTGRGSSGGGGGGGGGGGW